MKIVRNELNGVAVFAVEDKVEIDLHNCEAFKTAFLDLLVESDRTAVLDAANIEFFDSAGMGSLLAVQKQFKAREGILHLARLSRSVQEIFEMVGLDVVFPVYAEINEAVEKAQE